MKTETITWVTDGTLPDDSILVLIEVPNPDSDDADDTEVFAGFVDGEIWRDSEAIPVERVVAWADMPRGSRSRT